VHHAADDARAGDGSADAAPGSTLSSGCGPSAAIPAPNHHGTPFIAGSTTVSAASSGASVGASAGSTGLFNRDHDEILGAELARVVGGARHGRLRERAAFLEPPAVVTQCHQRRAARQCREPRVAFERQMRAEEPADNAGADYTTTGIGSHSC